MEFTYDQLPARVIFAAGARAQTGRELERLGISRAVILSTPQQADLAGEFANLIGDRAASLYPGATMHTPVEVTRAALGTVSEVEADGLLAVGGGSTIGLGKAIALRTGLPQLAVPTTYAGSEMTPILGQTENGVKTTLRDPGVLPRAVIYDPELTVSLPARLSGPSGMNAIAHAVEALYAQAANPVTSLMAEAAIGALAEALPRVVADGGDIVARGTALYGAWLAGACLGTVGMALHHKICHTLGGAFDLPHADVHCLMLPHTAAYNREAALAAMARVGRALGVVDGPDGLFDLLGRVGVKKSLAEFGLGPADLERAADLAVANPYYNPRPVTRDDILHMLQAAHRGDRPG